MKNILIILFIFISATVFAKDEKPTKVNFIDFQVKEVKNETLGGDAHWAKEGETVTTAIVKNNSDGNTYEIQFPFGTEKLLIEDYIKHHKEFIMDESALSKLVGTYFMFEYEGPLKVNGKRSEIYELKDEDRETVKKLYLQRKKDIILPLNAIPIGSVMSFVYETAKGSPASGGTKATNHSTKVN
jgi:hypothetical protein